jgi:hypothetical protein
MEPYLPQGQVEPGNLFQILLWLVCAFTYLLKDTLAGKMMGVIREFAGGAGPTVGIVNIELNENMELAYPPSISPSGA